MSTAMRPRVRVIGVCDEAIASDVEAGVFTLENMRYHARVEAFPHVRDLKVYLLLSYFRTGTYSGHVRFEQNRTDRVIRRERFAVHFDGSYELISLVLGFRRCVFSEAGGYTVYVEVENPSGIDWSVGDYPFVLFGPEG